MKIHIASPLRSYTHGKEAVDHNARSVQELLEVMDDAYPGIRFRMIDEQEVVRRHIRIFINGELTNDLDHPLAPTDTVRIICAISGG